MKNKTIIYCMIIFIYLFFLSCAKGKFDLEIMGNKEAIGADIYIDGSYSGKMKSFGKDGSLFGKWLTHGTHVIEIRKEGYQIYKEIIDIKETESEYYMDVELEKEEVK